MEYPSATSFLDLNGTLFGVIILEPISSGPYFETKFPSSWNRAPIEFDSKGVQVVLTRLPFAHVAVHLLKVVGVSLALKAQQDWTVFELAAPSVQVCGHVKSSPGKATMGCTSPTWALVCSSVLGKPQDTFSWEGPGTATCSMPKVAFGLTPDNRDRFGVWSVAPFGLKLGRVLRSTLIPQLALCPNGAAEGLGLVDSWDWFNGKPKGSVPLLAHTVLRVSVLT